MPFKGPVMYETVTKIPLIIRWPGVVPAGEARDQLIVNVDHFPTICDLLGLDIPEGLHGVSFKESIFHAAAEGREQVFLEYYSKVQTIDAIRTVVTGTYKYNLYQTGEEELYDLESDPYEIRNLAKFSAYAQCKRELKSRVINWVSKENDPYFSFPSVLQR